MINMEMITSISNSTICGVRNLVRDSSLRQECGNFVAEGYNIVKDIPKGYILELFLTKAAFEKHGDLEYLCEFVTLVSDKVMGAISDTKTPSGILAVCSMPRITTGESNRVILLDNLSDPGNVGTILRTATACGITEVWTYGNCADLYSPKVVRSSMGGIFHVTARKVEIEDIIGSVLVLDMDGENLYEMDSVPQSFVIVIGSESRGVSPEIRELASKVISLPMGENMQSLNAGVSLSVALYHLIHNFG